MLIRRMTAVFGKLQGDTLELHDGLNILEAPNEAGKSTWCAFLLSMLYGVKPGDRRYAPWNGSPMQGHMDCLTREGELVIRRDTGTREEPMGVFQAVYAGTGQEVPGMTGESCGDALIGVKREVYERSAFIRQAGLPFSYEANLEKQLASYLPSGTPIGPKSLEKELEKARNHLAELERQEAERQQAAEKVPRSPQEETAAIQARVKADLLRKDLEARHIPPEDTIARLRGAVVNLITAQKSVHRAMEDREEAERVLRNAAGAVNETAFAGKPPAEAERIPLDLPPRPRFPRWLAALLAAAGLTVGAITYRMTQSILAGLAACSVLLAVCFILASWVVHQRQLSWESMAVRRRKRRQVELEKYAELYRVLESARTEAASRAISAKRISDSFRASEHALLQEVHRFAPGVTDLAGADEQLRVCAQRRKELAAAEAAAAAFPASAVSTEQNLLSRRTSEIFRVLTEDRHSGASMDRYLRPSAGEGPYGREPEKLSTGCTGQLYLAARLAISELALPDTAPIVLDDALASFDDRRCAAALRFLREAANRRQVLLFTCHSREGKFFARDREVSVQRLTESA